jgi:predicted nucleotidyltransferase
MQRSRKPLEIPVGRKRLRSGAQVNPSHTRFFLKLSTGSRLVGVVRTDPFVSGLVCLERLAGRNVKVMVTRRKIRRACDQIARLFKPKRIVLFGSYAYGKPTNDSDVDLLVVMPFQGKGFRKAAEIRSRIDADFPLDLVVRTPGELSRRVSDGDFFLREATEKGEVLYAV